MLTRHAAAAAEACWRSAIAVARAQCAASWELRATMSNGAAVARSREGVEARKLLALAYGRFTDGFDTLDLKQAKALLDELA
jgi:predicted ATPase